MDLLNLSSGQKFPMFMIDPSMKIMKNSRQVRFIIYLDSGF